MRIILFAFLMFLSSGVFAIPTFPGAQGGGATSVGGRGGAIIEVINLNDSGPGSLRACAEVATGPRTCVFRVGGTIHLISAIGIRNPYVTIAGQTAPGGGVQIEAKGVSTNLLNINTNDVVVRYLRFRKGYASTCTINVCGNVTVYGTYNVLLDHLSLAWTMDDSLGFWSAGVLHDVSVQESIAAEGFAMQSTAIVVGAATAARAETITKVDILRNLISGFNHRGPFFGGKSGSVVNNIVYNMLNHSTQMYGGAVVDSIGNIKKRGPLSGTSYFEFEGLTNLTGADSTNGSPSMYMSGNIGWNQTNPAGDQWAMARQVSVYNGPPTGTIPSTWRRTTPLTNTANPIIAEPVGNLEANLLPTVGASRRLACDGTWVSNRDSVDTRLVNQYLNTTGIATIPKTETEVGGYPTIAGGSPCADVDHDGMPDVWETARGLNPNNAADRNTIASNGYTNVENYLNGVAAPVVTPPILQPLTVTASLPKYSFMANKDGSRVYSLVSMVPSREVTKVELSRDGFPPFFTDTAAPYEYNWCVTCFNATTEPLPRTATLYIKAYAADGTIATTVLNVEVKPYSEPLPPPPAPPELLSISAKLVESMSTTDILNVDVNVLSGCPTELTIIAKDATGSTSTSVIPVAAPVAVEPPVVEPPVVVPPPPPPVVTPPVVSCTTIVPVGGNVQSAITGAVAGDVVCLRDGVHKVSAGLNVTQSGTSAKPITLRSYPGEHAILDGTNKDTAVVWLITVKGTASWWRIKNLEIRNNPYGGGIRVDGTAHDNIVENNDIHHNGIKSSWAASGLSVYGSPANNLFLNNDLHHNRDIDNGDADGISGGNTGVSNVYRGNRAWRNSDDGFDFFCPQDGATCSPVVLDNNWAFENGYDDALNPLGNGQGFKMGGRRTNTTGTSGGNTVINSLAWGNKETGFTENSANRPNFFYNNTSYNNKVSNFGFWTSTVHVLKNNISFTGNLGITSASAANDEYNSWNLPVTVNAADFVSLSDTCARGPRKADGSLPDCDFLKLVPGSDLLEKGTSVGLPFTGSAPDLGAFEYK